MVDLSTMSDADLKALLAQATGGGAGSGLSALTDDQLRQMHATASANERSLGSEVLRKTEFASRGFLDRAAEVAMAPVDLIWKGAGAVGLPTPQTSAAESLKTGIHAVGQALSAPFQSVLPSDIGPNEPVSTGDKFAYGAGRGIADAGSIMVPGAAAARLAPAGSLVARVGQAASEAPIMQAASGAVGGGVTETTGNPWLGLIAGLSVPLGTAAARRVLTPVRSQLAPEQQRLAGVAAAENIPLSPGEESGSRFLRSVESVFGTLPLTAGPQRVRQQAQNSAFNRAVLRRAGIDDADFATPDVLDAARRRIGGEFDRLAAATTVHYDPEFQTDLMRTVVRYGRRLDVQRRPIFENFVNDIINSGGALDGPTYQTVRSDLGTLAKNHEANDPTLAQALRGLRNALDDAARRSMPAADRGAWDEARRQWGNMKVIQRAMQSSIADTLAGNVPPTAFHQAVKAQYPTAHAFGAGEMNDLERVGRQFVRDPIPNSGTAERSFIISMLTGGGIGTLTQGPGVGHAIGGAAATLLGPRAAQLAYNSPLVQAYLRNRLAADPTLTPEMLSAIAAGQLGDRGPGPRRSE
jgi:hypothetical protein